MNQFSAAVIELTSAGLHAKSEPRLDEHPRPIGKVRHEQRQSRRHIIERLVRGSRHMIDVEVIGVERHERQADMSTRGLRQQICARHHAEILDRRIHDRALIVADKVPDIAPCARSFVTGDAKPDPAGHSSDRERDGFR